MSYIFDVVNREQLPLPVRRAFEQFGADLGGRFQDVDDALAALGQGINAEPTRPVATITQSELVNSATLTTVASFTLPANTLGANDGLRVTVLGDLLNNTGAGQDFRVGLQFGGVSLGGGSSVTLTSDASRRGVWFTAEIVNRGSVSSQKGWGRFTVTTAGVESTQNWTAPAADVTVYKDFSVNTASDVTVTIFADFSAANANLSYRCHAVWVDVP
ncbi:MAG TPA: hypothetical protein VEA16_11000 [Vicinamibacterales bacterium]|nr:hypothetical protein [Vicinamibacterales bacterium]